MINEMTFNSIPMRNMFTNMRSAISRLFLSKGEQVHQEYLEDFYHENKPTPKLSKRQELQAEINVIQKKVKTLGYKDASKLGLHEKIRSLQEEQYEIVYDAIKVVNTMEAWDGESGDWQKLSIYDVDTNTLISTGHDIVQFTTDSFFAPHQSNEVKFSIEGKPNGDLIYYGAKFKVHSRYNQADVTAFYDNTPIK